MFFPMIYPIIDHIPSYYKLVAYSSIHIYIHMYYTICKYIHHAYIYIYIIHGMYMYIHIYIYVYMPSSRFSWDIPMNPSFAPQAHTFGRILRLLVKVASRCGPKALLSPMVARYGAVASEPFGGRPQGGSHRKTIGKW